MADVFYTILIIWVIWRIFGKSVVRTHVVHHQYDQPKSREGDVHISYDNKKQKSDKKDDGEYVEFEEIKG